MLNITAFFTIMLKPADNSLLSRREHKFFIIKFGSVLILTLHLVIIFLLFTLAAVLLSLFFNSLIIFIMNMYVSNLGFHVREEDLRNVFGPFGEVVSAKIITDRETGQSRGFGFVEMKSSEEGGKAMAALHNTKELEGRVISVSVAKEKEVRTPRSRW
jgi:hypothetical protein